jgi:hypothetical protein
MNLLVYYNTIEMNININHKNLSVQWFPAYGLLICKGLSYNLNVE